MLCMTKVYNNEKNIVPLLNTCRIQNTDIRRAGRFGAAQSGAAGRGGTRQDRTPTGRFAQDTTVPLAPLSFENNCPERSSEARTKEILRKPMEEQNKRLTPTSSTVYNQDDGRSSIRAIN